MADSKVDSKVRTILSELRDVNKDRRRTAVMKLGMVGGDQAVRTLISIVDNSQEDLIVRGRAALMLGKLKDDRAVPHLIRALEAPGFLTPIMPRKPWAKSAIGAPWTPCLISPIAAATRRATLLCWPCANWAMSPNWKRLLCRSRLSSALADAQRAPTCHLRLTCRLLICSPIHLLAR